MNPTIDDIRYFPCWETMTFAWELRVIEPYTVLAAIAAAGGIL